LSIRGEEFPGAWVHPGVIVLKLPFPKIALNVRRGELVNWKYKHR